MASSRRRYRRHRQKSLRLAAWNPIFHGAAGPPAICELPLEVCWSTPAGVSIRVFRQSLDFAPPWCRNPNAVHGETFKFALIRGEIANCLEREDKMMENLIALVALSAMEIVLGIDNIVFIVILTSRLPKEKQPFARRAGLGLALVMRILLLLSIKWVLGLTEPLFELSDLGIPLDWFGEHHEINAISVRDLILIGGGLFLIAKSVFEIHEKMEGHESTHEAKGHPSLGSVLAQIAILDIVFSLDSVITAVGMAKDIWVMVVAVILAVVVMLVFSEKISVFVERNPTLKVLALSFLILIGVTLLGEGTGMELNKGYIYSAMAFALLVEFVNIRVRRSSEHRKAKKMPAPGEAL